MSSLSLKISGKKFDFFNDFSLSLVYNSIASTFSFQGLISNDEQKELFKPLSYHEAKVFFNNELLLTGTILNTSTSVEGSQTLGSMSGYSKAGVLEDCEIPIELYPLQSDKLTIKEITEKLIKPFGIKLVIHNVDLSKKLETSTADSNQTVKGYINKLIVDLSKKLETSTADSNQTVKDYINELIKQKNIIFTHNSDGDIVFTKAKVNQNPVAFYNEGMPSTKISLSVDGQGFHSKITVQKQSTLDTDVTGEQTIINDLITSYRPAVKEQSSGDNDDTSNSASMILASELRAISLTIETDRWIWFDGKSEQMIKPNQIIEVESPSNFINKRTKFFVEKVDYKGNVEGIQATISCVLPECYNGQKPINIFE